MLAVSLGWVLFGLWFVLLVPSGVTMLLRSLPRIAGRLPESTDWPPLTVIVPARDEAAKIEPALRSLLASDYPRLELIAVDDRSQDDTGRIMDRLAETDPRLRAVHIAELPPGWLGKNHALHVAAESATSKWMLFTDADIHFSPEALRLAVRYAESRGLDHLALMPDMIQGGYVENALIAYFGVVFAMGTHVWLVPTRFQGAYVGVGAFNLVRAEAYRAAGGHLPIRMDVVDDVKLGKLMKRSGFKQDVLMAGPHVRVKWQASARGVIRGLEKNAFASLDYARWKLLGVTLVWLLLTLTPYAGALAFRDFRAWGYAAAVMLAHLLYGTTSLQFGGRFSVWPMFPIAAMAVLYAFWRSAVITLRHGGVRWRDTFYPLEELRRGVYY
jgi:glycosyltransferase involved in cell wall biosynthesis